MKTTLRRTLELQQITVIADVAVYESRPELGRVCSLGLDRPIGAERIAEVLPGMSAAAYRVLLDWVRELGLVDDDGELTPRGRRCAETAEAPCFERGQFTLRLVRDASLGTLIVDAVVRRPTRDEARPEHVSAYIDAVIGREFVSFEGRRGWVERTLGEHGVVGESVAIELVCELDFTSGENRRWLAWSDLGIRGRVDLDPLPSERVTAAFVRCEPRWDAARGHVAIPWDPNHPDTSFERAQSYPRMDIAGLGTFTNVHVEQVPVGPRDAAAARAWAARLHLDWLLATSHHVHGDERLLAFHHAVEGGPLQRFRPAFPDVDELATQLDSLATGPALRAAWRVTTTTDLCNFPRA